jgi:hypothetical protein
MDDNQRLQLQNMIQANNVEDQTGLIRTLKHSMILRTQVAQLVLLRAKYGDDAEKINIEGMSECNFLFTYYTDIYNKVRKGELDLQMLTKFLDVLKDIEDGVLNQHEGSFQIGSILKEMYVDSALKKAEKLNEHNEPTPEPKKAAVEISWRQFKKSHM